MDLTQLLQPIKTDKIRIGPEHDGGYVVAKNYLSPYLYSYGVGKMTAFEASYNILVPNCFIYLFDGTCRKPYHFLASHKNAKFSQKNVYNEKDLNIKEENVFIQMDIEGYEIDIFNNMSINTIQKIKQLCLEVHLSAAEEFEQLENFFKILNKYFYLVHIHANNFVSNKKTKKNLFIKSIYGLPPVIELTYVNKLHYTDSIILEDRPGPIQGLDFPNNNVAKDIKLNWWIKKSKKK